MHLRAPPKKAALEPMAAVFIGVALLHFLGGGILWGLLPLWQPAPYGSKADMQEDAERYWFSPADYYREGTEPAPVKAGPSPVKVTPSLAKAPPSQAKTSPPQKESPPSPAETVGTLAEMPLEPPPAPVATRTTTKVITLSPVVELPSDTGVPLVRPTRPPVTMMDVLKQEKLEEAQKKAAGGADMDPVLKALDAALKKTWNAPPVSEVPVLQRDASLTVTISRDGSIHEIKLVRSSGSAVLDASVLEAGKAVKKISESLPASFPKERYTVEVNFHIE